MVLQYTLSIHEMNMGKVSCLILEHYQGPMYPEPLCGSKESRGQENMVKSRKILVQCLLEVKYELVPIRVEN